MAAHRCPSSPLAPAASAPLLRLQIVNLQSASECCPPALPHHPPVPPVALPVLRHSSLSLQIVNLQSASEFASHRMNRDTWRDDMVRSLVENNFILLLVSAFAAFHT